MGKKEVKIVKGRLKEFYEKKGLSIRKLAKIYDCGPATIQRKLHNYKIRVRPSMSIKISIPKNRIRFLYEKKKRTSSQISKIYSCSPTTILNRLKEYNIKIREICEAHIKYPKTDFSKNLIEKAYLIGFRLGDLHVRKYEKNGKVIVVECASTVPEQITLIDSLFKKYTHVHKSSPDKRGISRISCSLNQTFAFLLNKEDSVEPWILANDRLFFAFLGGYIDAEGDIGIYSKNTASLRIGTYDKNILSQIQRKLFSKGISSTLVLDRPRGSRVNLSKIDKYKDKHYTTKNDFWRLAVYRKKALWKLLGSLGPYLKHLRFKQRLSQARENIVWRNQEFGNLRMN